VKRKPRQNLVISVFGKKGEGKSFLVQEIIEDFRRVVILDTMGEYGKEEQSLEEAISGLISLKDKRRFRYPVRLVDDEDALKVLRVVYEMEDVLIVVEETSFYTNPNYLPDELKRLVRYGRHKRISQIYVSRRPAEIHRDLTAQSDLIVSFRQHEPADIKYLSAVMGPQAAMLPTLPKYGVMVSGELERAPLAVLERMSATPSRFLLTRADDED
jgi:hypothetical protein